MQMVKVHIVQVRLSDDELRRLDETARSLGVSRSEILRMGIDEAEAGLRRLRMRKRNMHKLIEAAREVPGDEARWLGKTWDADA